MDRGNRIYNGMPSKLMNMLYDGLMTRYGEIESFPKGWSIFSLYLARTCGVVEKKLEEENDKYYLQTASQLNAQLNKQYRGELQEMQKQKNKVMAINIQRTKDQCADELSKILTKMLLLNDNHVSIAMISGLVGKLRGETNE